MKIKTIDKEIDRRIDALDLTNRQAKLAKAFINLNCALNDNGIYPIDANEITLLITPIIAKALRNTLGSGLFGREDYFQGFGYNFKVESKLQ